MHWVIVTNWRLGMIFFFFCVCERERDLRKDTWKFALGSSTKVGSWARQISAAMSQASLHCRKWNGKKKTKNYEKTEHIIYIHICTSYHIWCWWVGGNIGYETGEQFAERITLSASKKFRNRLATNRSCLNNLWKRSAGCKIELSLHRKMSNKQKPQLHGTKK